MEKTKQEQKINITQSLMIRIEELISRYPSDKRKSALLPVLHEIQDAHDNWLSVELMDKVAEIIQIKPIEVYEVATFYSMFNLQPVGKYTLEFCRTSPCCLNGAENLMDYTCEKLGIKPNETTKDKLFTIKEVECLGACGYAPMLQLGDYYKENLDKRKIDQLIEDCKRDKIKLHDK